MMVGMHLQTDISPFYKCWVQQEGVTVCGYISRESQISLEQLWNSPFANDSAGNAGGGKVGAVIQSQTGLTSVSSWNSKMIWDGAEALTFPLILQFMAYSDAKVEVDDPIKYLMKFSSPELNDISPMGARPLPVALNIGRKIKVPALDSDAGVFIKHVEYDQNAPKTKGGYFATNEITLTMCTGRALNRSDIDLIFN